MTTTRYALDRRPVEHVRVAVCDWLEAHGVVPDAVAICPGWIELRPEARQVAFLGYEFEGDPAARFPRIRLNEDRTAAIRVERVVQLESPPMPFPVEQGALL